MTEKNTPTETKKILVVFDSQTMRNMIISMLESNENYKILSTDNGLDALKMIIEDKPDCLISYIDVPSISGYSLARVIKNTKSLSNISVILCATEDNTVFRFWSENSKADEFYVLRPNNSQYLYKLIDDSIADYADEINFELSANEKADIFSLITKAYDSELFNLYIIRNAYKTTGTIINTSFLLKRMSENLSGVCDYDMAAIIVNQDPLIERFYKKGPISPQDFNDFITICHSDFKKRISNRKEYKWEQCDSETEEIDTSDENYQRIKSYEIFPIDSSKRYPFTFHIASCKEDLFNKRTLDRLEYFTDMYAILLDNAVTFHKTISSELKMRNSFGRFLPAKIIDDIVSGKTSVSDSVGERRKVAVLITDIRNFTTLSEKNSPEQVVEFLNAFFEKMGEIIKRHGGTIDKFMGDAIMALFGAPDSYLDNANRAANAALEMSQMEIDTSLINLPEGYSFSFGSGIHYGEMIVGTIGSKQKKDYTVIGDNVNIASRVQGLTKIFGAKIIVTEDVKNDIDRFQNNGNENTDPQNIMHTSRYLGLVKVKGKNLPVKIFEIDSELNKYSDTFTSNYSKGLDRFTDGDLTGALSYFKNALEEIPDDKSCLYCIEQCKKTISEGIPLEWDGSFKLTEK